MRTRLLTALIVCGAVLCAARSAFAYPMLQVDIAGSTYNSTLQENVAAVNSDPLHPGQFTLYVYLNNPSDTQRDATYYIAAALTPQVFPPGGNFGSFTFGSQATPFAYVDTTPNNGIPDGTTVNVPAPGSTKVFATNDMIYGNPPLESYVSCSATVTLNCRDPGDLASHGIYNTYFKEFSFKFNTPTQRADPYDVATDSASAPTPNAIGSMYYEAFTVDTSFLRGYQVHFDLYSELAKAGGDIDVNQFAPFSHTARSSSGFVPLPEPASLTLLGTGVAALVAARRRKRGVRDTSR